MNIPCLFLLISHGIFYYDFQPGVEPASLWLPKMKSFSITEK